MKKLTLASLLFLVLALSWGFGCSQSANVDDEPLSIGAPIANLENTYRSAPGVDGSLRITGLDGTVSEGLQIRATNHITNEAVQVVSDENGFFQLSLSAVQEGQTIILEALNSVGELVEQTSFISSYQDPTPLEINQTDIAIYTPKNIALVTSAGDPSISLVEVDLDLRQQTNTFLLEDPDTKEALDDLMLIESFNNAKLAVVLDRTKLKFYLVDLGNLKVKPDPIPLVGLLANIANENTIRLDITIDDEVEESETVIREGLTAAIKVFNQKIENQPDANTPLTLNGLINDEESQIVVIGTFSSNGLLGKFTVRNDDLEVLSEDTMVFPGAQLAGLSIFNNRTRAIVGNQSVQQVLGDDDRIIYSVNLETMERLSGLIITGTPEEMVINSDETKVWVSLNDQHQILEIDPITLTAGRTYPTNPQPTRLSLDATGSVITNLNQIDTTVSTILVE